MGVDRTAVLIGELESPIAHYQVEKATPARSTLLGADFIIVGVYDYPNTGIKGVVEYERERRGISKLEQAVFHRIRTNI